MKTFTIIFVQFQWIRGTNPGAEFDSTRQKEIKTMLIVSFMMQLDTIGETVPKFKDFNLSWTAFQFNKEKSEKCN